MARKPHHRPGAMVALLLALLALALGGCGGGDDGGDSGDSAADKKQQGSALTESPGDERILRAAADNYRKDTTRLIAAVRAGLNKGSYDNALNDSVYDLRIAIYEFDQAMRRIKFKPTQESRVVQILDNDVAAIDRLDPIIEAKRWPSNTEAQVKEVLGDVEDTKLKVDELLDEGS